jgi:hypothetical protein
MIGTALIASAPGQMICLEALAGLQGRRAAALLEPGLSEDDRRAGGDEIDRHAGDDLVAAVGDRGEAVHQAKATERRMPVPRPSQANAEHGRRGRPSECADQHLAFEPDVEDAGAFGIETGQAASSSGTDRRMVESRTWIMALKTSMSGALSLDRFHADRSGPSDANSDWT